MEELPSRVVPDMSPGHTHWDALSQPQLTHAFLDRFSHVQGQCCQVILLLGKSPVPRRQVKPSLDAPAMGWAGAASLAAIP